MAYESRIRADPDYLQALGRAFYNFTCLELIAVMMLKKLRPVGAEIVGKKANARKIANALGDAIKDTSPPLENELRGHLEKFHADFAGAIDSRNKLLHAHPYTAPDGVQILRYAPDHTRWFSSADVEWPIEDVYAAAKLFEDLAIMGGDLYNRDLTWARP